MELKLREMNDRLYNSKRNIITGLLKQFLYLVLNFVVRTLVIYKLGLTIQGLNGLFGSIISVLNIVDLGFASAIIYVLYKPIVENNKEEICCILNYLRKIYRYVGLVILGIGGCFIPFLKIIVIKNNDIEINYYFVFLIFLINASIPYFMFFFKSTLLSAFQREDCVNKSYSISLFITKAIQMISILCFSNYYIFVLCMPIGTIIDNILVDYYSKKHFSDIKPYGDISTKLKVELRGKIKGVYIGKLSDIFRNSLDNIVLSSIASISIVAIYDNYYYIYSAVYGFMGAIIHSIMASVGNSIAKESVKKNYADMVEFNILFMLIVGWCSVFLVCLYQPFMFLWMNGKHELMLSNFDMVLFCIYFWVINMTYVRSMYLDGNGLFLECIGVCIWETISNLFLNIILGVLFGISGIIIASIFSIIVFNFFGRTKVLFRHYYKCSMKEFCVSNIRLCCITIIIGGLTAIICLLINFDPLWAFIIKIVICICVPPFIFMTLMKNTREYLVMYKYYNKIVKNINII